MRDRGYVVIGFPGGGQSAIGVGQYTEVFAGQLLPCDARLVITGPTDRADWDAQVLAIFGALSADENQYGGGELFFRCELRGAKRERI